MPQMPTRRIGEDNVAEMGLGLMGLSAFYGQVETNEERFKFLDVAFEDGWTNWDSADIYGDSEELVGKWFKRTGNREKIFLATKFGIVMGGGSGRSVDGRPEYVKSSCEKSLKRLSIDTIDLYYYHRADQTTPIEVTVRAMAELVKEGKVRYLGLSEVSSATLRRAHAVHPISAVQIEYSPFTLDIEDPNIALLKTCRELGVTVVAYSPLGRGLLTGRYKSPDDFEADDFRRSLPRFSKENFPKMLEVVDGLTEIGKKHNATASQVTLAWMLAQGKDIIPIPGTKVLKYLRENLAAIDVKLNEEEVARVRKLAEDSDVGQVGRYSPAVMASTFADTPPL